MLIKNLKIIFRNLERYKLFTGLNLTGLSIGLVCVFMIVLWVLKWLQNFAYKTEISWWIFLLGGALAIFIAFLTVSWQSWKAANKNPVESLRYE
jgi:putative ABC transport system permease protein